MLSATGKEKMLSATGKEIEQDFSCLLLSLLSKATCPCHRDLQDTNSFR